MEAEQKHIPYQQPLARVSEQDLRNEMEYLSSNKLMDTLLQSVGGLIAVLNTSRQVLALNQKFLRTLGIEDVCAVMGLRPGEVFSCAHVWEGNDGCGTTRFCPSCGLALATVVSLSGQESSERTCALQVQKNGVNRDLYLSVRAAPVLLDGHQFILIFIQDISIQQKWASLERIFFHDVNNLLTPLLGTAELLQLQNLPLETRETLADMQLILQRLTQEIALQQNLHQGGAESTYKIQYSRFALASLLCELSKTLQHHHSLTGKQLRLDCTPENLFVNTDYSILMRVLTNMVLNAAEATEIGESFRLYTQLKNGWVHIIVWNSAVINHHHIPRIFQRNFSTKGSWGRGLGTFSMRLFGEEFLGGKVDFSSQEGHGTSFWIALPAEES